MCHESSIYKKPVIILKHLAMLREVTTMACCSGFPLRVTQSSSQCESITIASESISACDSLCGPILSVSHLDRPVRFLQHKETFSFLLGSHCLDRIAPLIDLALMFPVKGFVCVASLSRQHELMSLSLALLNSWNGLWCIVFSNTCATLFFSFLSLL